MNRLDLIIDALNSFTQRTVDIKSGTRRMCCGDPIEEKHTQHCIGLKALAAARELRALKPVVWWNPEYETDFAIALNKFQGWNVPLYALDEVKHD